MRVRAGDALAVFIFVVYGLAVIGVISGVVVFVRFLGGILQ